MLFCVLYYRAHDVLFGILCNVVREILHVLDPQARAILCARYCTCLFCSVDRQAQACVISRAQYCPSVDPQARAIVLADHAVWLIRRGTEMKILVPQ